MVKTLSGGIPIKGSDVIVRFPSRLKHDITRLAKKNRRSRRQEILVAVERHLEDEVAQKKNSVKDRAQRDAADKQFNLKNKADSRGADAKDNAAYKKDFRRNDFARNPSPSLPE